MTRKRFIAVAVLIAVAGAAVASYWLGAGARYRLYTNAHAGDCWRAVELTTLESSTISPEHVHAPTRDADGGVHARIEYTMDRVLGGRTLSVECTFAADGRLAAVVFDGSALEADALAEVRRELGR